MALIAIFALPILALILILAEAQKEREQETRVEVEEYSDWAWPRRNVGPKGRTRLP